jgi:hypothetical protein
MCRINCAHVTLQLSFRSFVLVNSPTYAIDQKLWSTGPHPCHLLLLDPNPPLSLLGMAVLLQANAIARYNMLRRLPSRLVCELRGIQAKRAAPMTHAHTWMGSRCCNKPRIAIDRAVSWRCVGRSLVSKFHELICSFLNKLRREQGL